MVAELDIAGESDRVADAPSLETARTEKRPRKPSKRLLESQGQIPPEVTPKPRGRKLQNPNIAIYNDPPSPPATQATDCSTKWEHQKGVNSASQPKKRTRAYKTDPVAPEPWEVEFNAAQDNQAKFRVILKALSHEDFPDCINISKRKAAANLDIELDPLDPLSLWYKFVTLEVLNTIANHTNEYESTQFKASEHT
jgi:hypothetical protein